MTAEEITQYLTELNVELRMMEIKGEVSLYDGAVMCLAFKARPTVPEADYLLAMKMLALRADTEDENDAEFLIKHLGLKGPHEVLAIVADYYPNKEVKPKTVLWLDDYFAQ